MQSAPRGQIRVRKVRFEYPADLEVRWNPRRPEFASVANAASLLMPYIEPYVVKSVRSALDDLSPELRVRTEGYLKQELQHHVQHRRFNDLVVARYPRMTRFEGWMRRTFAWLSATRSRSFNLAFAAGFETVAYSSARWTDEHLDELFEGADPVPATLLLWHLAEEVEHKTVAFDVYDEAGGGRWMYGAGMVASFVLLAWFTLIGTMMMLFADRRFFRPVTHFRLFKWSLSLVFEIVPNMLASAMPGHHPSDFNDPPFLTTWLRTYDPTTGTIPVPAVVDESRRHP